MSQERENPEQDAIELVTRTGLRLRVRPATAADEAALADFFRQVTPDDLRFRFLGSVQEVSHARLMEMIRVDQKSTESIIATAPEEGDLIVAAAMLALDPRGERAEVAISLRADHKSRGIGWTLLDHLADRAKMKGVQVLESIESRDNSAAISLEREMGFVGEPVEGDPTLIVLRRNLA